MLRVTEIFHSIQGESTHAGRPCTFVRLTGCPMRCTWCDSEYTFTGGDHFTIEQIMQRCATLAAAWWKSPAVSRWRSAKRSTSFGGFAMKNTSLY